MDNRALSMKRDYVNLGRPAVDRPTSFIQRSDTDFPHFVGAADDRTQDQQVARMSEAKSGIKCRSSYCGCRHGLAVSRCGIACMQ